MLDGETVRIVESYMYKNNMFLREDDPCTSTYKGIFSLKIVEKILKNKKPCDLNDKSIKTYATIIMTDELRRKRIRLRKKRRQAWLQERESTHKKVDEWLEAKKHYEDTIAPIVLYMYGITSKMQYCIIENIGFLVPKMSYITSQMYNEKPEPIVDFSK